MAEAAKSVYDYLGNGENVVKRIESRTGSHVLERAAKIGFRSHEYRLVLIDE